MCWNNQDSTESITKVLGHESYQLSSFFTECDLDTPLLNVIHRLVVINRLPPRVLQVSHHSNYYTKCTSKAGQVCVAQFTIFEYYCNSAIVELSRAILN